MLPSLIHTAGNLPSATNGAGLLYLIGIVAFGASALARAGRK